MIAGDAFDAARQRCDELHAVDLEAVADRHPENRDPRVLTDEGMFSIGDVDGAEHRVDDPARNLAALAFHRSLQTGTDIGGNVDL